MVPAKIYRPRVRQASLSEGTGNIVLAEYVMRGSLAFGDVMEEGDICDIVLSYGNVFTEVEVEMNADGELVRGRVWRTLHADGSIDTEQLVIPPGVKTVIMTIAAESAATASNTIRFDIAQALSDVQKAMFIANLGALSAPSGTKMLFNQSTPPLGWTRLATYNDYALRLVNDTVGTGGSLAFSTVFGRTATDAHSLTASQQAIVTPSYTGIGGTFQINQGGIPYSASFAGLEPGGITASIIAGQIGAITVTVTSAGTISQIGGGQSHQHGIDMRLRYVDVIIGVKD